MPSKRKSSACVDYVPALCTHRPSLLPIEWLSEALGLAQRGRQRPLRAGNLVKLGHLEEVKVVTRLTLCTHHRKPCTPVCTCCGQHHSVARSPGNLSLVTSSR